MTFQKSVDDLLNDIAEACGPSLFSQKEVEDFLDFCLCALRDCPEELRLKVRACWRRGDDATEDGNMYALLLWEGSVWLMDEEIELDSHQRNRWVSWPRGEDLLDEEGAAVDAAVILNFGLPPDRSATIEGERIGDAVDDLEATGMWTARAAAHGTTRYVYRADFPEDDPARLDDYDNDMNYDPIENPGDEDGVVDLTERRRSRNRAKLESVLESTAATMAEDPGFQAAVRKSAAERKMGEHAAGAQLYKKRDKVLCVDGAVPKTWKGRIVEHEWHDWGDGPEHHYLVMWTTPAGAKHEGLYNQDQLEAAK